MISDSASSPKRCHRLVSLSVVGGFLDGIRIDFADGLNCLIGHRGTGKTTVLEFVRYALDEFPPGEGGKQYRRRVEALVKSNLGDGRIRLALETRDGLEYTIDRSASGEPMVLTTDGQPTDVRINRHGMVKIEANPYDPAWCSYFTMRDRKAVEASYVLPRGLRQLWWRQQGMCPHCRLPLGGIGEWGLFQCDHDKHHIVPRANGGSDELENLWLLHSTCHRQLHASAGR